MGAGNTFKRKEIKYLLDWQDYKAMRQAIKPYLLEDEFGLHTITSIYYDSPAYELAQKSMQSPLYKEKFRIRSYCVPSGNDEIYLEIKKKFNGVGNKRRIGMPYQTAMTYLTGGQMPTMDKPIDNQILNEIDWINSRYNLEPKVMLAYDRIAMFDPSDPNFRVTFDFNIRYREDHLTLNAGPSGERLTPEVAVLMEVKAIGGFPFWFSEALNQNQLYPGKYSKYSKFYVKEVPAEIAASHLVAVGQQQVNGGGIHAKLSSVH